MRSKSVLMLVGVVFVASATALVARALMRPPPPMTIVKEVPAARPVVFRVLGAQRDLVPGDFIDGAALAWTEVAEADLRASHFSVRSDGDALGVERALHGATPRRPIRAGEPLTRDALVRAGEPGFVAAVLAPGMRAVSIPTSAVASNAGLVSAGDWVDVILSLERDTVAASDASNPVATLAAQTLLRRVRVLALNNSTESITPAALGEPAAPDGRDRPARAAGRPSYETLTLEVTPEAAERLAVAREVGSLQVALRGARGDGDTAAAPDPRRVTRLGDTTEIFSGTGRRGASPTVKTYLGKQQGSISF
ncbi:MAG: Flp pilus assembly protein CpaB [Candidatus Dactylopiibacterium sp.]|nr:Flp pilus assembly protein CpaB [Candidatus Dactylopiibacterium sp.]